jgi:glycosyltransferase involved in cell wall biosynthesis
VSELRILQICHNHPSLHPGGTEIFAHDLFTALKAVPGVQSAFLACVSGLHRDPKPGTRLQAMGHNGDEILLWSGHYDRFYQSQVDLYGVVPELSAFLRAFRPDIVHVHHTQLLGMEMLFLIRRVLPRARIVYTLHDYFPICAHEGQMVTTREHTLCQSASPDACHRCFPKATPDKFVLRETHIKNMFRTVDRFLAPSKFLEQRYIAWGLAPNRIEVMRNGRPPLAPAARPDTARGNVFATFGNVSPFKGTLVALDAAARLRAGGKADFELRIHGGMPFQTEAFQTRFEAALQAAAPAARHLGAYESSRLPALLAAVDWVVVPSIWWENAPLVISEAFQAGKPVICSDIGGMAEMVEDGVNGLHFRANDPADLARVMRRALTEKSLRAKLVAGIPHVPTIAECAAQHIKLYGSLSTPLAETLPALPEHVAARAAEAGLGTVIRFGVPQ